MRAYWMIATLVAFLLTPAARANGPAERPNGFHVGAASGRADMSYAGADADGTAELFAGYHFKVPLAVEVGWFDLGTIVTPHSPDRGSVFDAGGLGVSALGQIRMGRFSPYGRLGMLAWQEDGHRTTIAGQVPFEEDGTDLYWGVGLDGRVAAGLTLRGEWRTLEMRDADGDQWLVGVCYRF